MSLNFPESPSDGDTHTVGNKTYSYSATDGYWQFVQDGSSLTLTNLGTHLYPSADDTYNIGTADNQWKDLHIAGSLNIGGATITANTDGSLNFPAGSAVEASIPTVLTDLSITDGTVGQVLTATGIGTYYFADPFKKTDISITTAAAGSTALTYDNATSTFTYTPPDLSSYSTFSGAYADLTGKPSIPSELVDLNYVDLTGVTNGQILVYNSTSGNWENSDNAGGVDLTAFSVTTNTASATPALSYDNTTGTFTYTPPAISGFISLSDLSITTAGSASGGGSLTYNSTDGTFTFTPADTSGFLTSVSLELTDLTNVSASSPLDTQILRYDSTAGQWEPSSEVTGIALTDLSVTVATTASGSGNLQYNDSSGAFTFTKPDLSGYALSTDLFSGSYTDLTDKPTIPANIEDLSNVTMQEGEGVALADGHILVYDATATEWTNAPNSAIALTDLSVGTDAAASGSGGLAYDNTTGVFTYTPPVIPADVSDLTDTQGLLAKPFIVSVDPTSYDGNQGQLFTIRGGNFTTGGTVKFKDQSGTYYSAAVSSVTSTSEVTATTPKDFTVADGPLGVRFEAPNSGPTTELTNVIATGSMPVWTTPGGNLANYTIGQNTSVTVVATDADNSPITYTVTLGSLPPNVSLNSSTGVISGTGPTSVSSLTTYTFTITAEDNAGNTVDQEFNITYINNVVGEQVFTSTGIQTFTVPLGVTSICAVCVGGGGGGAGSTQVNGISGCGGGGGGLAYANDIAVTPGEVLTVIVGAGGTGGTANVGGIGGGFSDIKRGTTRLVGAGGGYGGARNKTTGSGGSGGQVFVGTGGTGGTGGVGSNGNAGGGGGGAAGYSGNGGTGGSLGSGSPGSNGIGGGGGGGGATNSLTSNISTQGRGGGVGIYGQGTSGLGGGTTNAIGGNGSVGVFSGDGGIAYGGGGAGAEDDSPSRAGSGRQGAVRIIYGNGLSYPNNALI